MVLMIMMMMILLPLLLIFMVVVPVTDQIMTGTTVMMDKCRNMIMTVSTVCRN